MTEEEKAKYQEAISNYQLLLPKIKNYKKEIEKLKAEKLKLEEIILKQDKTIQNFQRGIR